MRWSCLFFRSKIKSGCIVGTDWNKAGIIEAQCERFFFHEDSFVFWKGHMSVLVYIIWECTVW